MTWVESKDKSKLLWCNVHQREANWIDPQDRPACNPNLGGIMIPCSVVDLTEEVEIEK